jgi:hypothetical protein
MKKKARKSWRQKNFKLVYFGNSFSAQEEANDIFWLNASIEAKSAAMAQFVHDELTKQGLIEHGPKLLRLTATFRRA